MKVIGLVLVSALALASCTSDQLDDGFAIACAAVPTADAGFQIYVGTGKVSAKVINDEKLAVQAAAAACNGPRPADVKTAISYVQRITTQILQAMATAKQQAGG